MELDWHTDLSEATEIWVKDLEGNEWLWQEEKDRDKRISTHDPADRIGGPFTLYAFVDEGHGEHVYIFAVVDSYFPIHDLVRAQSWEEAYEVYVDWAAEHRHIKIDEKDLKKAEDLGPLSWSHEGEFDEEVMEDVQYTSTGIPVNTDNVNGNEVAFLRASVPEEEELP